MISRPFARSFERIGGKHDAIVPHLHVDAAVGWVSCFLTEYDIAR